ncbi:hypothetical protein, partial [Kerstersia sp.]|uniref:hypothetical protein n=1 Tax=Kerstersia sp. TaxID=1930783 RepID=UPI003F8F44DA
GKWRKSVLKTAHQQRWPLTRFLLAGRHGFSGWLSNDSYNRLRFSLALAVRACAGFPFLLVR